MFEFSDQDFSSKAVIRVIGIGGAGGNIVDDVAKEVDEVEYIRANTDAQALGNSTTGVALQLGEQLTRGLGAGANPEVGKGSAEENRDKICELLKGADMLFIAAGMGGGTGTGAAPVVAEIAKELNILTVAVVTRPFAFEGPQRMKAAQHGMAELSKHVDSLITIPNDKLLTVLGKKATLVSAFKEANGVLKGAVKGIADLITKPGLINVDFADVRTVMSEKGMAMMGSGESSGENRAEEAARSAVSCPLLEDVNLNGAKGVLVNITGGIDMSIGEFEVVGDTIKTFTSEEATVVVGTVIDTEMTDYMRVTVVITGLESSNAPSSRRAPPKVDKTPTPVKINSENNDNIGVRSSVVSHAASPATTQKHKDTVDYEAYHCSPLLRQEENDAGSNISHEDELLNVPAFLRRNEEETVD
ncbi:MAG: cell division protein FtsZ [Legionellales bacterium]|jgi:cell division protein FtsZ|nr:cell division protein FtsZ [Legionellales bacterium]